MRSRLLLLTCARAHLHPLLAESNEADYSFKIRYANYGPYYDEASDYNMGWDLGAPVTGVCASFAANSTASPVTTSLPATPCPVTVPAGAMLTAGTTKVPGGVCTGDTVIKLVNGEDDTDLAAPGNNRNGNGNAVANDGAGVACARAWGCERATGLSGALTPPISQIMGRSIARWCSTSTAGRRR